MADFSKQFCERNDMGFPGDFDILEEFNMLNESTYVSMICEGYGFVAIGKIEGKCVLVEVLESMEIVEDEVDENHLSSLMYGVDNNQ